MRGIVNSINCGCGVNNFHSYDEIPFYDEYKPTEVTLSQGAGWTFMAFIPTALCKQMYDKYTSLYSIVYQSPVRRNKNSGRDFFFIILDTSKLKDK